MPLRRSNRKAERRSSLLNRLQEESWQLELIVSGVVIFLLLGMYEPANDLGLTVSKTTMGNSALSLIVPTLYSFVFIAYVALIGMFLFHLALRGMWIGAIGLRSVSGGFDYDELNYQPRYQNFLRRRLGSFDDYIMRLERNASVTFSLAFLLFFAILSFGLFFLAITGGILLVTLGDGNLDSSDKNSMSPALFYGTLVFAVCWVLFLMFGGLLYLIDFLTFGWFKRRRIIGKIYYPVYRFFGWVSLARLYRPFYYNIIDNAFGRRLVRVYAAIAFVGMLLTTIQFTPFPNFAYTFNHHGVVRADQYVDQLDLAEDYSYVFVLPSLGSRYAREDYVELFVPLHEKRQQRILERRFPELRPLTPSSLGMMNRVRSADLEQAQIDSTLEALSSIYRVHLNDSLVRNVPWRFYEHPVRKQPGLLYDIPAYDLPRGEYWVRVEYQYYRNDSTYWRELAVIPFLR